MSTTCPCCKQFVPYGKHCDYPMLDLINETGGITTEAKKQEEIEQAREETRQQCAQAFIDWIDPVDGLHPTWVESVENAILNAGKQDKGEGV